MVSLKMSIFLHIFVLVFATQIFWRKRLHDNTELVSHLRENGTIHASRVAGAMEQIDRGLFVPPGEGDPYVDSPVPIGYNATISAPHMHAACLELLNNHLQPGMRALDIGAGLIAFMCLFKFCKSKSNAQKCVDLHLLVFLIFGSIPW